MRPSGFETVASWVGRMFGVRPLGDAPSVAEGPATVASCRVDVLGGFTMNVGSTLTLVAWDQESPVGVPAATARVPGREHESSRSHGCIASVPEARGFTASLRQ